jgi:hypothetical protein
MATGPNSQKNTAARKRAQAKYNSKPEQVNNREDRNRARAKMVREGKARKGDGKDVAHKDGNTDNNNGSNLTMQSKRKNRSYARTKSAGKKNPRD